MSELYTLCTRTRHGTTITTRLGRSHRTPTSCRSIRLEGSVAILAHSTIVSPQRTAVPELVVAARASENIMAALDWPGNLRNCSARLWPILLSYRLRGTR